VTGETAQAGEGAPGYVKGRMVATRTPELRPPLRENSKTLDPAQVGAPPSPQAEGHAESL
jgi:hypothetical protein